MINASAVDPSLHRSFVARNGGTGGIHSFMKSQGATGGSKNEVESSWLILKGGSGRQLNEQWGTYLGTKGYTVGTLEERMKAFFSTGTQG